MNEEDLVLAWTANWRSADRGHKYANEGDQWSRGPAPKHATALLAELPTSGHISKSSKLIFK